jgi:hypothetical protein
MIIRFRPQPQELQRLEVGPIGPISGASPIGLPDLSLEERSLFQSTCAVYLNVVRRFLAHRFPDGKSISITFRRRMSSILFCTTHPTVGARQRNSWQLFCAVFLGSCFKKTESPRTSQAPFPPSRTGEVVALRLDDIDWRAGMCPTT